MKNWKEYIEQKFQPRGEYEIKQESKVISIKHIWTETIIYFYISSNYPQSVCDIQYGNENVKCGSGEYNYGDELEFNSENKEDIDEFLVPVFETGWSVKDVYLYGKYYKSTSYDLPNLKGAKLVHCHYSLLFLMLFPIFLIVEILIKYELIGRTKIIEIEPINSCRDIQK